MLETVLKSLLRSQHVDSTQFWGWSQYHKASGHFRLQRFKRSSFDLSCYHLEERLGIYTSPGSSSSGFPGDPTGGFPGGTLCPLEGGLHLVGECLWGGLQLHLEVPQQWAGEWGSGASGGFQVVPHLQNWPQTWCSQNVPRRRFLQIGFQTCGEDSQSEPDFHLSEHLPLLQSGGTALARSRRTRRHWGRWTSWLGRWWTRRWRRSWGRLPGPRRPSPRTRSRPAAGCSRDPPHLDLHLGPRWRWNWRALNLRPFRQCMAYSKNRFTTISLYHYIIENQILHLTCNMAFQED